MPFETTLLSELTIQDFFTIMTSFMLMILTLFFMLRCPNFTLRRIGVATIPAGYWVYRRHKKINAKPSYAEQLTPDERRALLHKIGGKKQKPLPFD
jgi:hypothetical protein